MSITIIGAGIGGLAAAIRLAVAGRHVRLFEQHPAVGGKMAEISQAGYRWDTGPSVITMRPVLAELFALAGRRLEDYLTLLPVEPLTRYFYPDGVILDATRDLPAMLGQIARLDEGDVEGYLGYLAYAARLHRITGPVFIYGHPPTWRSFLRVRLADALQVDAWRTMHRSLRRYVRSPHLRQLLARFATYAGSDPYRASATLNVIAHVELAGGVWYPQDGVYAIAGALARLAAELGVDIQTGRPVAAILIRDGRAAGIQLADGEQIQASAVIANVDVATVYHRLLPAGLVPPRQLSRLSRLDPSCSGFVLLLGVERLHPSLAHHNIFFSADYPAEFDAIFRRGQPPADPTIYVAITAKTDPGHAPPGCENWFVRVNAPPQAVVLDRRPEFDWNAQASTYASLVLDRLAAYGYDIRPFLRYQRLLTPLDLERQTGAWRGSLYGLSMNSPLAPFRRPSNRSPYLPGLYFVGGATHPGGGVPMVMLSAKVVAEMIGEDQQPVGKVVWTRMNTEQHGLER
ncbi:MAG: phytoene desaturase [Caldilineales bacterium]|nr:phytoene desaturase [Caldilineales bacterium]